jgi:hypothetical protein
MSTNTPLVAPRFDETVLRPEFAEVARYLELSLSVPLSSDQNDELACGEPPILENTSRFNLRVVLSQFWSKFWSKQVRARLRKMAPWLMSSAVLGMNLILHAPLFVLGASIAALTIRIVRAIIRSNPLCQKIWQAIVQKSGISESQMAELTACFAAGAWLSAMAPTQALFFQGAETYMNTLITGLGASATGTAGLVKLIFGALRLIFVIYVGIAVVRVVNAFRNDEDWVRFVA